MVTAFQMKEVVILLSQESLSAGNGALTRAKTRWSGQAKAGKRNPMFSSGKND
jgi:hypothetical protein